MSSTFTAFGEGIISREVPADGDRVLWIHGYTMDSSLWEPLWSHLPGWHHIGIDLPYHGQSQALPPTYTMPQLATLIGNIALEQGVRHIAGLSLGSLLTLQIAIEIPNAFDSVLLGSAGINHGPNDPYAGPHYWRLAALYRKHGPGHWMTEQWMRWPPDIFKGAANYPEFWRDLVNVIDRHRWEEFANGFMATLTAHRQIDTMDAIARIGMLTLLVVGEEEMPAFKKAATMLEATIPVCDVVYLPNAGHLCLLERPELSAQYIAAHWQNAKVAVP